MIELLGVSVRAPEGRWLLHRVCTRLRAGEVTAVVSTRAEERAALFDVVVGRTWPEEGRAWITRLPVGRGMLGRVRGLVADVRDIGTLAEHRSVLWNVLASSGFVSGVLRYPRPAQRQAALHALDVVRLREWASVPVSSLEAHLRVRVALARALARRPAVLLVRDVEPMAAGARSLWNTLGSLSRSERVVVLAGAADRDNAQAGADRLLALADGLLVFDGPAAAFTRTVVRRAPALA
jgi:ABC-type phosphate/phosphonate transport system ATPase subunit